MVDSKENDKFDLGVKRLRHKTTFPFEEALQEIYIECDVSCDSCPLTSLLCHRWTAYVLDKYEPSCPIDRNTNCTII